MPAFLVRMPVVIVARRTPFFFAGFAAPLGSFFGTFLAAGFFALDFFALDFFALGFLAATFFLGATFFLVAFFLTAAAFLVLAGAFFLAIYITDLSYMIFAIAEQHTCQNAMEKVFCVDTVSALPLP
ncbi:MAG: hypothetical protein P8J37_10190 [Fuerstiella sp.]|nr:hypothetical protein [Fuerstiella sp.]